MKSKLKLGDLKVQSFVTTGSDVNAETLKGGTFGDPIETNFNCPGYTQLCQTENPFVCNTQNFNQCGTPPITQQYFGCNYESVLIICRPTRDGGSLC
ncbi:MAG: pinensin family lanthipeptide [Bacteroidota bacterium]